MAGFTDYLEQKLLDHIFTDPAYTPAATLYIGLSTSAPAEGGTGITEPSGNGYARVATTAADWSAATAGDPSSKTNTAVKSFPAATGSWGTVTHFFIADASTAGNILVFDALTASKTIGAGDTASFAVGALKVQLGDPADTYG